MLLAILATIPLRASASDAYESKTYPRSAAKKLMVDTDAGMITLKQAIDGPTLVDVSPAAAPGDDCRVARDLRGGVLHLGARAARNALEVSKSSSAGFAIVGWFEEIEARSGSGTVDFAVLRRKAEIKTGSGDIRIASSADATLRSGSGAISVATGSGSLNASFPKATRLRTDIRSAAGSVRNDFGDKDAAPSLSFKSGSGDATITRKPQ